MADKPAKPDAMKDLKWLLWWLLIIFILWLALGGRARQDQNTSPFLVPTPGESTIW